LLGWSGMVLGCKKVSKMVFNDNLMTTKKKKTVFFEKRYKRTLLVIHEENLDFFGRKPHAPLIGVKSENERMVIVPH
jgi:hypothetical protein